MSRPYAVTDELLFELMMDGFRSGLLTGLGNVTNGDPAMLNAIADRAIGQFLDDPAMRAELGELVERRMTGRVYGPLILP